MCSYNLESEGIPKLVIDFKTLCITKLTQSKINGSANPIQYFSSHLSWNPDQRLDLISGQLTNFETDEDDEVEGSEKRKKKEVKEGIPRVVQRERAVSRLFFLILTKAKALFQSLAH